MATYSVRKNADGTMTFRAGRYVEAISTTGKTPVELAVVLRWAAVTAGISVKEEDITRTIQGLKGV